MTSKTFKSEHGRSLTIDPSDGHNIGLGTTGRYLALKIEDAPALALAILEAAGYGEEVVTDGSPDGHVQVAKYYLNEGVKAHERATAESRERAELEAEALELRNEYFDKECAWSDINDGGQTLWLRMARKARELAKEATQ